MFVNNRHHSVFRIDRGIVLKRTFLEKNFLVAEDGLKMAEQSIENSKEPEDEVPRQVHDIQLEETVYRRPEKRKGSTEKCLYKAR